MFIRKAIFGALIFLLGFSGAAFAQIQLGAQQVFANPTGSMRPGKGVTTLPSALTYPNPLFSGTVGTGIAMGGNNISGAGTITVTTGFSGPGIGLTGTAASLTAGNVTTNANLTGDLISIGNATTLATVNSNVGTFGSATQIPQLTVNGKGLITAVANVTITGVAPGGAAGGDLGGTYPNPTINNAPVIAKVLTGYTSGAGTVSAADSILSAIQKINGNDALKAPIASPTFTGTVTIPNGAALGTPASGSIATTLLTGTLQAAQEPAHTGDVTNTAGSLALTLATAQPAVHTWALAQTFTVAPVFTDAAGSRTALGLGALATVTPGSGCATWITTPSSANFAACMTDETGTPGAVVFSNSPTLATPIFTTSFTSPLHIGGSAASSTLTLESTSGAGTTDAILLKTASQVDRVQIATGGQVNIGPNVASTANLTINRNTVAPTAYTGSAALQITGADGVGTLTLMDNYGTGQFGTLALRSARGIGSAFTASQSGDGLGLLSFVGATANNTFPSVTGGAGGALIAGAASENWSATNQGTQLRFFVTPNTTAAVSLAMILQNSGGLTIGGSTDPGGGSLQVNATIVAPNLTSDAGLTDTTLCWKNTATTGTFLKGSGTLGICLGTSGAQFKTAFAPMVGGLEEVMGLNLQNYRYRNGYGDSGARMQYGLTAQDVDRVMPDLVRRDTSGEVVNYDAGAFLFIGLRAIQQLKADNDNLETRLTKLENRK